METMDPPSALRPLTLRSLPPHLAEISSLKARLAQSQLALERYAQLESKLGTFTDEPVWNAWVSQVPSNVRWFLSRLTG